VTDETGIAGVFEFDLVWTPDPQGNIPPEAVPPVDPDRPTLFTALQEQIGLKLQPARGSVPALVIDSVGRPSPD
jgi:uncharacterized protein (TIGR03435 family)